MTSLYLLAHFTVLNLLQKLLLHYLCECVLHRIIRERGWGGGVRGRDSGWPFIFVDDAYLTRRELSRNKK